MDFLEHVVAGQLLWSSTGMILCYSRSSVHRINYSWPSRLWLYTSKEAARGGGSVSTAKN